MVEDAGDGALHLVFSGLPLHARIREHARLLVRRAPLFVAIGAVPAVLVLAIGIDDDGRLTRFAVSLGAAMVALIVVCSSLAVVVARMPPRVVRIDEHNIFERVGSTTQERTWSWVVRATENANGIEMELRADPLRSLRLAPTKPDRLLLENGRVPPEQIARARALLRARSLLD